MKPRVTNRTSRFIAATCNCGWPIRSFVMNRRWNYFCPTCGSEAIKVGSHVLYSHNGDTVPGVVSWMLPRMVRVQFNLPEGDRTLTVSSRKLRLQT